MKALFVALMAALWMLVNPAQADDTKAVELKMAYQLPVAHHLSRSVEKFARLVTDRSGGSITFRLFPAGEYFTDRNMNRAIINGELDLGLNSTAMWTTTVDALNVLDLPFMLNDYEAVDRALDGGLGSILGKLMEEKGVKPIIWADYGFAQFASNKKLLAMPDDFKGLKIRGYGEIPDDIIKALGGIPVIMGAAEVYMAIKSGVVDGQTSGQTATFDRRIYEVAKYLTISNHAFCEFLLAMNKEAWERLSPKQQKIMTEVAVEIRDEIRSETKSEDMKAIADLRAEEMVVHELDARELAAWKKATAPVVEKFMKERGALGQRLIDECRAADANL